VGALVKLRYPIGLQGCIGRRAIDRLGDVSAFGTLLAATVFGVVIWLLIEWELLALDNTSILLWVVEFILSGVLAVGMSWSHIRRRVSGQYDTDEIEG